jgi:hypothetical protein
MKFLLAAIAACAFAVPALANAACTGAVYHQYDYFVGHWNVYHANGKRFATDIVTKELDGCALLEQWHGQSTRGSGYSEYDKHTKRWVQAFFQNDGTVLVFYGNWTPQGMVFTGDDYTDAGALEHNKVLFRPFKNGGFEEYWTVSPDGRTWKVVFDGFFRPQ